MIARRSLKSPARRSPPFNPSRSPTPPPGQRRRQGEGMSDSIASLRRQIGNAGDLQSVVRTMKALAVSSIGQYERSVSALADYYRTVELGLGACFRESGTGDNRNRHTKRRRSQCGGRCCFRIRSGSGRTIQRRGGGLRDQDALRAARKAPGLGRRGARACPSDRRRAATGRPLRRSEFCPGHHPAGRADPDRKRSAACQRRRRARSTSSITASKPGRFTRPSASDCCRSMRKWQQGLAKSPLADR